MSCVSCGHTMEKVDDYVFRCPRCGTMTVHWAGNSRSDTYVPKLVERVREFRRLHGTNLDEHMAADWHRLGLDESVNPPAERKAP